MDALLQVKDLKTTFKTLRGEITAVDGVNFQVNKGEILGIVGESGCGKSVTSQSIMRLYNEKDLVKCSITGSNNFSVSLYHLCWVLSENTKSPFCFKNHFCCLLSSNAFDA